MCEYFFLCEVYSQNILNEAKVVLYLSLHKAACATPGFSCVNEACE